MNYISISIVNILAMLVLIYMIYKNEIIEIKMKRYFLLGILATLIVNVAEMGSSCFLSPHSKVRTINIIFNIVGFSISPGIPILIGAAFCNQSFKFKSFLMLPFIVNLILTVLSPSMEFIFSVSSENVYNRGSLFFVYIISYVSSMTVLFRETIRSTKRYQNKNRITLILLFIFILIGTTIQVRFPIVHTTWISVSLAIAIYYAYFCELREKYDALTNVFNRRAYECELQRLANLGVATVIIFDVDNFKMINDTYGHGRGDQYLNTIAEIIKDTFHNVGLCYRIGGDEFCVLSEKTDNELIEDSLKNFLKSIEEYIIKDVNMPEVSIGHAFYNRFKEGNIEAVVEKADMHLYRCKKQHKVVQT